jgi:dihydrofolate synthase / folylpolyglutamate synthase
VDIDSLLQPFARFGIRLELERMQKLLSHLNNPQNQVPFIHVGGTNGKGSVCAYLSAILTEAGYRVGRYISPHLVDWNERICIDEQQISSEKLGELIAQIKVVIPPGTESPTQFEVITAAAWLHFAQSQVDIAVMEVGLGGRFDATNVADPLISVITSISREHWQLLGNTITEIAGEKAGIIKAGRPVVVGQLPIEAEQVMRSRSQTLASPIYFPQPSRQLADGYAEYLGENYSFPYPLPLAGQIQLANSALAIAALEILQNQGWDKITPTTIVDGIAKTQWLGRIQWTTWKNQKLLIDGTHNPGGAKVFRDYVDTLNQKSITWVMGMMAKKDHTEIFQTLLKPGDRVLLVPVPHSDSAEPSYLAQLASETTPQLQLSQAEEDLESALDRAFSISENLVILCGSLYLIGDFLSKSSMEN